MKKEFYNYGNFEKYKVPHNTEHLEVLQEASPIETTSHLQFQDKVLRIKNIQERRYKLQLEQKRRRIVAIKKAKEELLNKSKISTHQDAFQKGTDPLIENTNEDFIFDWEVPFMDDAESSKKGDRSPKEKSLKKSKKEEKPLIKAKFSIGAKLIGIISTILIVSLAGLTYLVSYFVSQDARVNAEDNNLTINSRAASDADNRFSTVVSNVEMFLDLIDDSNNDEIQILKNSNSFFDRNSEIAAVYLPTIKDFFYNKAFLITNELEETQFLDYVNSENEYIEMAESGTFMIENASPNFNLPLLAIFYPLTSFDNYNEVVIFYSPEAMAESFSAGSVNQSFMLNSEGIVLVHPDVDAMLLAKDMSENPLYLQMISSNQNNEQIYFTDADEVEYIGAYNLISNSSAGVLTIVQTQKVLEAVNATTRRNLYLTFAILSISIMIIWFFSKSLSNPLKSLTEVTNQINQGNFDKEIFEELKGKRKDEIGVLIGSTKNEGQILDTFSRLTNKAVTKAVIRKEIDFDAHLKDITIFFSDIRGFTAISDGFSKRFGEKSAGEIIGFLNDYMARMVNCITITGGNVDKFEGDAIMACWGVLRNDSLDFEKLPDSDPKKAELVAEHENHKKQDAINAVKAVVGMRYALMKYNKDAEIFTENHKNEETAQYKPHIRIGCGLNSGRATVGFMGSYDKMEFTSIGDAVNLASRTESSNKPCGTDGLMTEDTYNLLKMDYIRCEENNYHLNAENEENEIIVEKIPVTFEVKGKGKQHFYGIVNMPKFDIEKFFKTAEPDFVVDDDCKKCVGPNGPKNLNDVRMLLGIPIPDFSGVNLDEEENKTKITTN